MKKTLTLMAFALFCSQRMLHAQGAPAAPKSMSFMDILLMFVVPFILIFYVFFIRPQKKEQQKRKDLLGAVAKGDQVTTIGGIMGRVSSIAGDTVTIIIDDKNEVKLKVLKRAISSIKGKTDDPDDSGADKETKKE